MTTYRLRAGVHVQRGADGVAQLADPALGRALRLGDSDARLLQALGRGGRPDQLAGQAKLAVPDVERRLAALARLYLLQGKRSQSRLRLQAERDAFAKHCADSDPAAEPLIWPLGRDPPRHACQGTGTCCGASFLGPLNGADVARVAKLQFGSRTGGLGRLGADSGNPAAVFEHVDFGGQRHAGMARGEDGRCVAQGDDQLCDIHREHGMDAKPVACRLFPLRFHRVPQGVAVSLLLACDGYDRARPAADSQWQKRDAEIRALLAEHAPAVRVQVPAELTAGVPVSQDEWLQLRAKLFALEPADADARAWLAACVPEVVAATAAADEKLREGPETAAHARLPAAFADGRRDQPMFHADAAQDLADQLQARSRDLAERRRRADAERLADLRAAVVSLLRQDAWAERSAQATPPARRHLADVVANDLPAYVAVGHLDAGMAALVTRVAVAEALACVLADRAGRREITAADTTRALHVAYRSEPDVAALARILHTSH